MSNNNIASEFSSIRTTDSNIVMGLKQGILTDNGATPWYAEIGIGTPPQVLKFMIDTGTTHTWITSSTCKTCACEAHRRFDPKNSSTYDPVGNSDKPVPIDFGAWGQLLAYLGRDAFKVGDPVEVEGMRFYLATYYDGSQFEGLACDGGISIPFVSPPEPARKSDLPKHILHKSSDTDSDQILDKLASGGLIDSRIATFACIPGEKGVCIFGECGVQFTPNQVPVIESGPCYMLWTVPLESFRYNGQEVLKNVNFILDTGSSRFKGDPEYIHKIIDTVTDEGRLPQIISNQQDLGKYKNITLILNGQAYILTPQQYFLKINEEWRLAFHPMEGLETYLLVGSVFLDTVISSFDCDKRAVTLYKWKCAKV